MGKKLLDVDIARHARRAGFPDDEVAIAVAVALAESAGDPSSHNDVPPDDSYGLWQINMLGGLGPERRRQFGIRSDAELLSPAVNAHAAFLVWRDARRSWRPWSTWLHGTYRQFLDRGRAAAAAAEGEPAEPGALVLRRYLQLAKPRQVGADVVAVQRASGMNAADCNGVFGWQTRWHVRRFQGRHGLARDGVVGPLTAAAMRLTWAGGA